LVVGSVRSTYPQNPDASLKMKRRPAIVQKTHRFAGFRYQKALLVFGGTANVHPSTQTWDASFSKTGNQNEPHEAPIEFIRHKYFICSKL
jgi:hypothetical protein